MHAGASEHDFLCNADGVQMIRDDIDNEGVTHVMIAACSRRAKTEAFHFPTVAMARANLREGVIWVVADRRRGTTKSRQEMADDYVRMGCAEVKKMKVPAGNPNAATNKRILVVGGGMSGMTAALEAAEDRLRGGAGRKRRRSSAAGRPSCGSACRSSAPYAEPQDTGVAELVAAGRARIRSINVHLNATLAETAGAPGRFGVRDRAGERRDHDRGDVGAIVQATGFSTYDIAKLPELGGGKSANVVDQAGLEALAMAANGGADQAPPTASEVKSVVFVQCAGQRDDTGTHLPYCSGHCCATSIKQAMYFKDANPDVDTVVLYTDLRVPGMGEDFYRSAQNKGVIFTKGKVSQVEAAGDACTVQFPRPDPRRGRRDRRRSGGARHRPGAELRRRHRRCRDDEAGDRREVKPISILNLTYRQGQDLPQLKHGFTDSHFICFPYETRRTGIYAAGPVRRPMDIAQATEDATGAALKAIQAVENAALGRAAHPRSGDLSFPIVRLEGCTQCKRCTVECPFGAIDEDEKRFPVFNESRCRRCGTCMGACPVRVISFENYSVDTVGAQIKAVDMPDEFSEKPRILMLACENDAYPALDMAGMQRARLLAPSCA